MSRKSENLAAEDRDEEKPVGKAVDEATEAATAAEAEAVAAPTTAVDVSLPGLLTAVAEMADVLPTVLVAVAAL